MKKFSTHCLVASILFIASYSFSQAQQNCGCDFTIGTAPLTFTSGNTIDGSNVQPGDIVCLTGSRTGNLKLINFEGSAQSPIIIQNCNGAYDLNSTGLSYGITFQRSKYFRLTGSGTPGVDRGIVVHGPNVMGVSLELLSTNFEVDHLEVYDCTFAGIMAKTDPTCASETWRGNFTMYDISIHDNYVHDTETGEGLYIGNSLYNSGMTRDGCGVVYPHDIVGAKIYNNHTDLTASEGIQVGAVVSGCEIYSNLVERYGQAPLYGSTAHGNGIQIGEATGGLCYNNFIRNEPPSGQTDLTANGIICLGRGDNIMFNNVIINPSGNGIFIDERTPATQTGAGSGYDVINNTIINAKMHGLSLYSEQVQDHIIKNNIIIINNTSTHKYIYKLKFGSDSAAVTASNNFTRAYSAISAAGFVNAGTNDYHPANGSPLIDAGTSSVSAQGVTFDHDNISRPQGSGYDIGAFEGSGSEVLDLFINAAGAEITSGNDTWEADQPHAYLSTATPTYATGSVNAFSTGRTNPTIAPASVLGTLRWTLETTGSTTITYNIPVPVANEAYEIELFFALKNGEFETVESGDRRFDIYTEGSFTAAYDVYDNAGDAAASYLYQVTPTDATLQISLIEHTNARAQINALRVYGPLEDGGRYGNLSSTPILNPVVEKGSMVKIFPNPASDVVRLTADKADNYSLKIFNSLSQVVSTFDVDLQAGETKDLDVSRLAANQVYIVQVQAAGGQREVIKLVKAEMK